MAGFIKPLKALALSAAALAILAGCTTPAAYEPRTPGRSTGYTDRALTNNRFRVTFTGNANTPREVVENYLLLRAAEVTRAAGYADFMFDDRDVQAQTRYSAFPQPMGPGWGWWGGPGYWRFRPTWGYYGGFGPDVNVVSTTRYEGFAEIVVLTPDQARGNPQAINAAQVLSHLGPSAPPPPPPPPPPPR